ncbi:FAR-17a/AIG1-like protein [Cyathus striatus]|nr:FAR-17a/AIG1-like protein [Cyathus striatus]
MSMMLFPISRMIFHSASAAIMLYGYNSLEKLVQLDTLVRSQYGGHSQFLTIQGLALAFLTMLFGLLVDIGPSLRSFKVIKRLILVIALPLAVVISSIYWFLILLAPQLILQQNRLETEPSSSYTNPPIFRIPLSIDLALHACPGIALVLDFILLEKKYDGSLAKFGAPFIIGSFATWYGWWVERCAKYNNGTFPYPFLTENPWHIRLYIYIGASVLALCSFRALNAFHPAGR